MEKYFKTPLAFFLAFMMLVILARDSKGIVVSNLKDKAQYKEYKNEGVYGYRIDYPSNFMEISQTRPQDIHLFISPDGEASLKIWGGAGRITFIKKAYLEEMESITKVGGKIGYHIQQAGWFVITWIQDNHVNYEKVFCGKIYDNCFLFSFSEEQRQYYEPIVNHLEASFRHGDLNGPATPSQGTIGPVFTIMIRNTGKAPIATGAGDVVNNALWIKFTNGKEELLVSSKNAARMENVIGGIHDVQVSVDRKKIFFMSGAWATSDSIHVVDRETKNEKYLCPGNTLKVIQSGPSAGKLIIQQHRYYGPPNYGSYDHFYLVDENGKELKDLGEELKDY